MSVGRVPGLISQPLGTPSLYTQRGFALAGLDPANSAIFTDDFELSPNGTSVAGWTNGTGGTSSILMNLSGARGGICRLDSAAAASQAAQIYTNAVAIGNSATEAWYVACRARFPTAIDAQANLGVGLQGGGLASFMLAGFCGPLNGANFGVQYDGALGAGSFLNFGVAKDTNFHVFELWCTGTTTLNARMDQGSVFTAVRAASPSDCFPFCHARNGTTAASRQTDVDWFIMITGRN